MALLTEDLATAAQLTQRHPLKAYDAVQLAVALRSQRTLTVRQHSLTFVSGDTPLSTAAHAEQLPTDNPFAHVSPTDAPGASV